MVLHPEESEAELRQTLERLKISVDELNVENASLKSQRELNQQETHEFVAYFNSEMEKKDRDLEEVNNSILKVQRDSVDAMERTRRQYESQMSTLSDEKEKEITLKVTKLRILEEEMKALTDLKAFKDQLESSVALSKAEIKRMRDDHEYKMVRLTHPEAEGKLFLNP